MSDLSTTEYVVLGLLAETPSHGFAIARKLEADEDLGRIYTVRRPLVYRALDRLVDRGLAAPAHVERGDSGPNRVIHHITDEGRRALDGWLSNPVDHVRDMRIGFLLKVALLLRSGRSPASLVQAQRSSLAPTLHALHKAPDDDHVEIWRNHSARMAREYLEELTQVYR